MSGGERAARPAADVVFVRGRGAVDFGGVASSGLLRACDRRARFWSCSRLCGVSRAIGWLWASWIDSDRAVRGVDMVVVVSLVFPTVLHDALLERPGRYTENFAKQLRSKPA